MYNPLSGGILSGMQSLRVYYFYYCHLPTCGSFVMKFILFVLSVLAFLAGFIILVSAKSAIHEIEGFVLYIVSAVLFSGAAVVDAINQFAKKVDATTPES